MSEPFKYQYQVLSDEELAVMAGHYEMFNDAKLQHDDDYEELDEMTIDEFVEFNAKTAQSYIEPRVNASDTAINTGAPREKLLDVASNILKLNLQPEILAFSDTNAEDTSLGRSFTHLVKKSYELEGDDVKQQLRILYILEQGTIYLEEAWTPYTKKRKKIRNKRPSSVNTGYSDIQWSARDLTEYMCEKNIIDITGVFLGNMREFDINKQPYIFTREVMSRAQAKAIYGNWDNWDYVPQGIRSTFDSGEEGDVPYRDFRLYTIEDQQVEVIKYQNVWEDEYQIYLNGTMMLPVDFPMPWEWTAQGDEGKCYSITKVVLEPISPYFAMGKSMMSKVRVHAELLDEMLRQMLRKTKQSTNPPVGNLTGLKLTDRLFDPGVMWEGVNPDRIKKLIDHQGVTASEYEFYRMLNQGLDNMTVSPTFQGQEGQRNKTATETMELQRQAQLALTFTVFSVRLMEERLAYLRTQNILENWTRPIDIEVIDEVNGIVRNKYRRVTVENAEMGDEVGTAQISFIEDEPTPEMRRKTSYDLLNEQVGENATGINRSFISVTLLRRYRISWKARVNPSERESSNLNKLLLGEELAQVGQYFGAQAMNMDGYKKRFAKTWGRNYEDIFIPNDLAQMQAALGQPGAQQGEMVDRAKANVGAQAMKQPQTTL